QDGEHHGNGEQQQTRPPAPRLLLHDLVVVLKRLDPRSNQPLVDVLRWLRIREECTGELTRWWVLPVRVRLDGPQGRRTTERVQNEGDDPQSVVRRLLHDVDRNRCHYEPEQDSGLRLDPFSSLPLGIQTKPHRFVHHSEGRRVLLRGDLGHTAPPREG